ncbi:MAG: hypothetical protein L3K09_06055 [Thermoplasmata archaeon]|nr:hypothetical protein [Thermoplasmata archaeon]
MGDPVTGIDIATWTAIAAWALVIGTLAVMYWQTLQAQRLHSANAVMELRERFDSSRVRQARRQLALQLLEGKEKEIGNWEVPAFFELMGAMTHRRALDETLVWHAFGGWITNYWFALCHPVDIVGSHRSDFRDPLVLAEFEWLKDRMHAIDRRRLGSAHSKLLSIEEESREIMLAESRLEPN